MCWSGRPVVDEKDEVKLSGLAPVIGLIEVRCLKLLLLRLPLIRKSLLKFAWSEDLGSDDLKLSEIYCLGWSLEIDIDPKSLLELPK